MRPVRIIVAASCVAVSSAAGASGQAEYAFRWDPAHGGPASIAQALAALGLAGKERTTFVVRYIDVARPPGLPEDYVAIGRERTSDKDRDTMYKLRGPDPPPGALATWKCPLRGKAETKREVDIGWTGDAAPRRAHSVSCTVDAPAARALPKSLDPRPASCTSRMERVRSGDVKIEQWTFPRGQQVFEVSFPGTDDAATLERFLTRIVDPLARHDAVPLHDSKTELGSRC